MDCNISKTKCSSMKRADINQLATNCGVDPSLFTNKVKLCEAIVDKNKQVQPALVIQVPQPQYAISNLQGMTIAQLKQFAKDRNLVGYSSAKTKAVLIAFIQSKLNRVVSRPVSPILRPSVEPQLPNLEGMTIAQLKQFAKDRNIVGYSSAKTKAALIAFIQAKLGRVISRPVSPIAEPVMVDLLPNLEGMTIVQLKQFAKDRNITGYSTAKTKAALIAFIRSKLQRIISRPVSPVEPQRQVEYNKQAIKDIINDIRASKGIGYDEITIDMVRERLDEDIPNLVEITREAIEELITEEPINQLRPISPIIPLQPSLSEMPIEDVLGLIKEPSLPSLEEITPVVSRAVTPMLSPIENKEREELRTIYQSLISGLNEFIERDLIYDVRLKLRLGEEKQQVLEQAQYSYVNKVDALIATMPAFNELDNKYKDEPEFMELSEYILSMFKAVEDEVDAYRPRTPSPEYRPVTPPLSPTYSPVYRPITPPLPTDLVMELVNELDVNQVYAQLGGKDTSLSEAEIRILIEEYFREVYNHFETFYQQIRVFKSEKEIIGILRNRYNQDLSILSSAFSKKYKENQTELKQLIQGIKLSREKIVKEEILSRPTGAIIRPTRRFPVQRVEEPIVRKPTVRFIEEPMVKEIIPVEEEGPVEIRRDLSMVNNVILKCLGLLS